MLFLVKNDALARPSVSEYRGKAGALPQRIFSPHDPRYWPVVSVHDRLQSSSVNEAMELSRQASADVYFACAEYWTPDSRTASNAVGAYAYWMDLDCGSEKAASGKGCATVELAK